MDPIGCTEDFFGNEKRAPDWLGYIGDEIPPNYIGIMINHYNDPYQATSTTESRRVFFVAQLKFCFGSSLIRWWFSMFFMFTTTWGNDPIGLIFFKWVETTT